MKQTEQDTQLIMRWCTVLERWRPCDPKDRGAVVFERVLPKPTYFNVTLEVFDGQQYGITTLCVEAANEDQANTKAVQDASDDGWQKIKVQFTRPG